MQTITTLITDLERIKATHGDLPVADSEGQLLPNLPPEVSAMPPTGMCARLPFGLITESINRKKLKKQLERLERDIDDAADEIGNAQTSLASLRDLIK